MPENPLMTIVLNLLTPLLIAAGLTDPAVARLTAQQAVAAYPATSPDEVLRVGSMLAFALAAADDLRLSAAPELSPALKLRLRGNANALDRTSRENGEFLTQARPARPQEPPRTEAAAAENRMEWAGAMTRAANELKAKAATVPPAEQAANNLWIKALTGAADDLTKANAPPASRKTELLRTTMLASAPGLVDFAAKANPAPSSASAAGARRR